MKKYTEDEKFMNEAIKEAKKAAKIGEVPIGCVIVCDGKIVGRGYNRRKIDKNTLSHAELTAIKKARTKRAYNFRSIFLSYHSYSLLRRHNDSKLHFSAHSSRKSLLYYQW